MNQISDNTPITYSIVGKTLTLKGLVKMDSIVSKKNKSIAITGASGKIGKNLVDELLKTNIRLKLFSRRPEKLNWKSKNCTVHTYANMTQDFSDCDTVIHLAVLNNDNRSASLSDFRQVNVEFTCSVAHAAQEAEVKRFIHISSVHALEIFRTDHYSQTKREAVKKLKSFEKLKICHIFSSKVLTFKHRGGVFASMFLKVIPALIPCTDQQRLNLAILDACQAERGGTIVCTEPAQDLIIYRSIKTAMNVGVGLTIVLLLWWIALPIWIAVKIGSPGPGFFRQKRIGRNKREFICYKFRTMVQGTKSAATHEIGKSSVTKIGNFLRTTKLDELPQAFNLLKCEMNLVGPRPCLPIQHELIEERNARDVFGVSPGITGLAQVVGIDMSAPKRLAEVDHQYIQTQSILGDIKLLWFTVTGSGQGDRVR